jgi:acyl carrier protein
MMMADFASYLASIVGSDGAPLRFDEPIGSQVSVDSIRMVELAIVLEQEFGLDLDDDTDLLAATVEDLYAQVRGGPHG